MKLVGIQIAKAQTMDLGVRQVQTGIAKNAVNSAEIICDPKQGSAVQGDTVHDNRHHGGPDQAVYVYFQEDYDWWAEQLGTVLAPGSFGENLTIVGRSCQGLRIGERLVLKNVILEISASRIPCEVFAKHMNDPAWVKKFRNARRPGVYCRVIQAGLVQLNETVELQESVGPSFDLIESFDLYYNPNPSADALSRILASPVAVRGRDEMVEQLAKLNS